MSDDSAWVKLSSKSEFDLLATLGTGSFGRVRLVKCNIDGKHYALKILKKIHVVKLKQVEHVLAEKKIMQQIRHPLVVRLFGAFQDAENLYLMLEMVQGGEFFTHLRKAGRFQDPMGRFYASEVTLVFEYLHSLHIVYRDLKTENVLVKHTGHILLSDFGLSLQAPVKAPVKVPVQALQVVGTVESMAPELATQLLAVTSTSTAGGRL